MNPPKHLLSGVKWGSMGSLLNFLLALFFSVILARMLGPTQSGLFALSFLPVQFFTTFDTFALSTILIQEKTIADNKIATFQKWFWIFGALFWGFCALIAPLLALFFQEQQLIPLILLNGIVFFIYPIGRISEIVLRRNINLKPIVQADWHGTILGGILAVLLASYMPSAFALAAFWLGRILFRNLKIRQQYPLPNASNAATWQDIKALRPLMMAYSGAEMLAYAKLALPAFWIGKQYGAEMLAFYRLATNTVQMPVSILSDFMNKTLLPIISGFKNDGRAKAKTGKWSLNGILWLSFPFVLSFSIFSEALIQLVYGADWQFAGTLLQYLSVLVLLSSLQNFFTFLFQGLGQGKSDLTMHAIGLISMIVALLMGTNQPIEWMVLYTSLAFLPPVCYGYVLMKRATPYKERFGLPVLGFLVALCLLIPPLWLLKTLLSPLPPLFTVLLLGIAVLFAWIGSSFWFGKKYLLQFWRFFR